MQKPKSLFCLLLFVLLTREAGALPATPINTNAPQLIIRLDDIGFCHGANMAFKKVAEAEMVTAVSVIVNTPWLDEAVEIIKQHPEISVGVHLNLNSEWKEYKWGPITPYDKVPSLVDPFGKFYGTRKELFAHKPKLEEVAKELRAQVDLAFKKGLKVAYIDNHMGAPISTVEFQEEMEKIAKEYHIGISRYYGEKEVPIVFSEPVETKLTKAIQNLHSITNNGVYVLVAHVGTDDAEMQAMTDLNLTGPREMSKHRQAEANVLCNLSYKSALAARGVQLVNYIEVRKRAEMVRPFTADKYEDVVRKALEK